MVPFLGNDYCYGAIVDNMNCLSVNEQQFGSSLHKNILDFYMQEFSCK